MLLCCFVLLIDPLFIVCCFIGVAFFVVCVVAVVDLCVLSVLLRVVLV